MNTIPDVGRIAPVAKSGFAYAIGNESSIPITYPVDLVSGDSKIPASAKFLHGRTASFTDTNRGIISLSKLS